MDNRKFDAQDVLHVLNIEIPATAFSRGKFMMQCPFCEDRTKHCSIDIIGGRYHCYRCGEGGSLVQLYGLLQSPPITDRNEVRDALRAAMERGVATSYVKKDVKLENTEPLAPIVKRDAAYRALLDMLPLTDTHKKNLLDRGLSEADIMRNGYKTTPEKKRVGAAFVADLMARADLSDLRGVPGFFLNERGKWDMKKSMRGFYVPFLDRKGRIQGMQYRVDNAELSRIKRKLGKYIWLQSRYVPAGGTFGTANTAYLHLRGEPQKNVIVTEGGLKADIAYALMGERYPFIAIAGTTATKLLPDALRYYKAHGTEKVMLALDMDKYSNAAVLTATRKIAAIARNAELDVTTLDWEQKKGIDDFMVYQRENPMAVMREYPFV